MQREPLFNVPTVVIALIAVFAAIHAVRDFLISPERDVEFILTFAFIPARYDNAVVLGGALPGGFGAELWTFVTYAFIHGDWTHFGFNSVWLLPFGSALARRFGAVRFLAFCAVTAAAGAAVHLATHAHEVFPVIGASATVSGAMAAAMRFAFQRGGPLGMLRGDDNESYRVPALPLRDLVRDSRVLLFIAVWFGLNMFFGMNSLPIAGADQPVAWQAHIGGFLAGLLLFSLFDPPQRNFPQSGEIDAMRH